MSKIKDKIWDAAEAIDIVFGEGYAKKNPELVGRVIQAQTHGDTMLASTEVLYDILRVISTPLIVKNPQ
jgi:hypothetical protein